MYIIQSQGFVDFFSLSFALCFHARTVTSFTSTSQWALNHGFLRTYNAIHQLRLFPISLLAEMFSVHHSSHSSYLANHVLFSIRTGKSLHNKGDKGYMQIAPLFIL